MSKRNRNTCCYEVAVCKSTFFCHFIKNNNIFLARNIDSICVILNVILKRLVLNNLKKQKKKKKKKKKISKDKTKELKREQEIEKKKKNENENAFYY